MRRSRLIAAALVSLGVASVGCNAKQPNGSECLKDSDCEFGRCVQYVCFDPNSSKLGDADTGTTDATEDAAPDAAEDTTDAADDAADDAEPDAAEDAAADTADDTTAADTAEPDTGASDTDTTDGDTVEDASDDT